MNKHKISLVIPNWNGAEKLAVNLPKVLKVKGIDEFIISDDASTDESCQLIERDFPQVILVKRHKNSGFSSNVNTGVSKASGDLVFLLNSDAVPEQDCLDYVLPHFENNKVFSVSLSTGGSWNWAKFKGGQFLHNQYGNDDDTQFHQTLWASGGSMVFVKRIWDEMGGLDTLFDPFYVEDTDLGYRATKRGYVNIFEPKSRVEHYKQVGVIAENFKRALVLATVERNTLLFIWKNITSFSFLLSHILYLILRVLRHPRFIAIVFRALAKFPKLMKKRRIERKFALLSDEDIFGLYKKN